MLPLSVRKRTHYRVEVRKPRFYQQSSADVNHAGGGGAPIERESGGGMDHFMAIENEEKKRQRKRKIHSSRK